MNKNLLTVAIGAALAAGASIAQAGVTVGGMAQVEYYNGTADCSVGAGSTAGAFAGSGNCGATTTRRQKSSGMIDNARGRLIVNADEEIGNMKALARYEFSVDTANSGQAADSNTAVGYDSTIRGFDQRTREKYVGLQGGFGTLTLGNLHGVYKRLGGVRWDSFNATVLEARGNGGQSGGDVGGQFAHNGFIPGAVKWESDKLMGPVVRLEILVAPDTSTNTVTGSDSGNGYDYQIGASIKPIKPLEIIVAHSNNKEQTNATANDDAKASKLGVRGVFGGTTVFAQAEKADINNSNGGNAGTAPATTGLALPGADGKWLLLGLSQKFGSSEVAVQVGRHDRDRANGAVGADAMYYAAGYFYHFSKTARVWVGGRKTDAEAGVINREATIFSAGMRKDF